MPKYQIFQCSKQTRKERTFSTILIDIFKNPFFISGNKRISWKSKRPSKQGSKFALRIRFIAKNCESEVFLNKKILTFL